MKSCGHPGDAQFADFRLVAGDDYVFGSQIVYECNPGYDKIKKKSSFLFVSFIVSILTPFIKNFLQLSHGESVKPQALLGRRLGWQHSSV